VRRGQPGPGQLAFGFAIQARVARYSRPLTSEERRESYAVQIPRMPESPDECQVTGLGWTKPCPHFRCRHHLGCDVLGKFVTVYREGVELEQYPATCSLAVARHGERTEPQIAAITGISLRTIERDMASALAKLRAAGLEHLLED
jgi:hypothetical protein